MDREHWFRTDSPSPVWPGVMGFLVVAFLLVFLFDIPAREGFNPSDDGVILAQAFRISQGEIPHVDFISNKPAMSGILHAIHFLLPFPFMVSARWFVAGEFALLSLIWVLLLLRLFPLQVSLVQKNLLVGAMALFVFFMNWGTLLSYPWSTIDALFFATLGMGLLWPVLIPGLSKPGFSSRIVGGFVLLSLASLSRQSFVLLQFFILAGMVWVRRDSLRGLWLPVLAGSLPLVAYPLYFFATGHGSEFLSQVSGRSEIVETAFLRPVKSFAKSPWAIGNALPLLWMGWMVLKRRKRVAMGITLRVLGRHPLTSRLYEAWSLVSVLAILAASMASFLLVDRMYLRQPWDFFIFLFFLLIYGRLTARLLPNQAAGLLWILVLAWVSSISLGVNSPAFFTGTLAAGGLVAGLSGGVRPLPGPRTRAMAIPLFLMVFLGVALHGQREVNYRDVESSALSHRLGDLFPGAGSIRCNANLYAYYQDLNRILALLPDSRNHFVMAPNNAAIYPLTGSRNPLPVDWLQRDEYIGAESLFYHRIGDVLAGEPLYLILDRFQTDALAFERIPMDYRQNAPGMKDDLFVKTFGLYKYEYLDYLLPSMERLSIESEFFVVFRTTAPAGRVRVMA